MECLLPPWRAHEAARHARRAGGDLLGQDRLRVHAHPSYAGPPLGARADRGERRPRNGLAGTQAQRPTLGAGGRGVREFPRETIPRREALLQRGRRGCHDLAQRDPRGLPVPRRP